MTNTGAAYFVQLAYWYFYLRTIHSFYHKFFQSFSDQWWISNARDNLDPVNGSACVDVDPIYHSYLRGVLCLRPLPLQALLRQSKARPGAGALILRY